MASERVWEPFWLHFGAILGAVLGPESERGEKVKIELSSRRELNFEGPGTPKNQQKIDFFGNPFREGFREPSWKHFWSSWGRFWPPGGTPLEVILGTFGVILKLQKKIQKKMGKGEGW